MGAPLTVGAPGGAGVVGGVVRSTVGDCCGTGTAGSLTGARSGAPPAGVGRGAAPTDVAAAPASGAAVRGAAPADGAPEGAPDLPPVDRRTSGAPRAGAGVAGAEVAVPAGGLAGGPSGAAPGPFGRSGRELAPRPDGVWPPRWPPVVSGASAARYAMSSTPAQSSAGIASRTTSRPTPCCVASCALATSSGPSVSVRMATPLSTQRIWVLG